MKSFLISLTLAASTACVQANLSPLDFHSPSGYLLTMLYAGNGVSITSIHNNGLLQSGFMVGTAHDPSGVVAVHVSLDGGPFVSATGTTSWKFQFPTGGSTWRDGTKHSISVRLQNTAGIVSRVSTIYVRKGTNLDINGDGYVDVIAGANNEGNGAVYVFYSSGSSGMVSVNDTAAGAKLTGLAGGDGFGVSVAMGDVNGDGFADVVVGAWSALGGINGAAYVFHSAGISGVPSAGAAAAGATFSGTQSGQLGTSIATGDVNGDGFADVIVGAWNVGGSSQGAAYVFHSAGSSGAVSANDAAAATVLTGTSGSGYFGFVVGAGDITGDGFADVVITAFGVATGAGVVYVFQSGGSSGVTSGNDGTATATLTGSTNGYNFGSSVAVGDVNGDGFADLVIGAPLAGVPARGAVYLFHSGGSSGVVSAADTAAVATFSGTVNSGSFGTSVAVGDIDGDGYGDIAVGATAIGGSQRGAVYLFRSRGSTGLLSSEASSAVAVLSGTLVNGRLGTSVALNDVNGDGFADLVAGAPQPGGSNGSAYIFTSSGAAGVVSAADTAASAKLSGTASGNLGYSLL